MRFIQSSILSCVMKVKVLTSFTKYAKHSILKLYDWQYATQLRQDDRVDQWISYHENTYQTFVEKDDAATFISTLKHDSINDQLWDIACDKIFLFDYCRNLHSCKIEAYSRLKNIQGKSVSRFLVNVRLNIFFIQDVFFEVQSILLELIIEYSLDDLTKYIYQLSWQRICDETIRNINLVSDHEILNENVKSRNVLIRTHNNLSKYEVIIIDFAQCRFREMSQSKAAWKHEKWRQNEKKAIEYIMKRKLKEAFE